MREIAVYDPSICCSTGVCGAAPNPGLARVANNLNLLALRLLPLPKVWSGFLGANVHGASCIGPLADLAENRERYQNTVAALANPLLTTLVLVAKPEPSVLAEPCGEVGN